MSLKRAFRRGGQYVSHIVVNLFVPFIHTIPKIIEIG